MFDIRIYGDPVLRKTAQPVTAFDEALKRFIEEMTATMREKDGVGLAANQVGQAIRVAVIDPTAGEREPFVTIRLKVKRPARVSVKASDAEGKEYTIENAEGILARAIQHEIDHLNGIMFVDRVSPLQRRLVAGKLKKLAKSGDQEK